MKRVSDPHEEAFDAVRRWWQAWVEKDLQTVERMVSPDYSERGDTGKRKNVGAHELIQQAVRYADACSITEWALSDPVTKLYEQVVVCTYAFRIAGKQGGRDFVYKGRATDVLSSKGGVWTLLSHEGSLESSRLTN